MFSQSMSQLCSLMRHTKLYMCVEITYTYIIILYVSNFYIHVFDKYVCKIYFLLRICNSFMNNNYMLCYNEILA